MKNGNKNNYSSRKTNLKIFSNVRLQYLYHRAKPRSITLNYHNTGKDSFSFFLFKVLNNDIMSVNTARNVTALLSYDNKK